jgi:hypothetical protein
MPRAPDATLAPRSRAVCRWTALMHLRGYGDRPSENGTLHGRATACAENLTGATRHCAVYVERCPRTDMVPSRRADAFIFPLFRVQDVVMGRPLVVAMTGLLLALAACGTDVASPTPTVEASGLPTTPSSPPTAPQAEEPVPLPPLPDQSLVIGRAASVEFVNLRGEVIERLPGFNLYYEWAVPGPVIVRSHRVYYILDIESHELRPLASRDEAFELAPQFQEGSIPRTSGSAWSMNPTRGEPPMRRASGRSRSPRPTVRRCWPSGPASASRRPRSSRTRTDRTRDPSRVRRASLPLRLRKSSAGLRTAALLWF